MKLKTLAAKCKRDGIFRLYDRRNHVALIAEFWSCYLGRDGVVAAHDVAAMMCLLKVARICTNPHKIDSWVDIAGYAACGGEIAGRGAGE